MPATSPRPPRHTRRCLRGPLAFAPGWFLLVVCSQGSLLRSGDIDIDFRRGDANGDGQVNITDAVASLGFLFTGGTLVTCLDAADSTDDGEVNITDPINTLGMLFLGTPVHPAPGPWACGPDPTADAIGCERYALCPPTGGDNVALELAAATAATIGPAGGTLVTTAADGTVYTLSIPEDSLPVGTEITMTPVVAIEGYPLADGVAAGVDFAPAGLVFAAPALLTIETARTPPAGTTAVALAYEGDAASYTREILGSGAGSFTMPMEHFSGGTVGFATAEELASLADPSGFSCFAGALTAALVATPPDLPGLHQAYRDCFAGTVLPDIENAASDEKLAVALGQLSMWQDVSRLALGLNLFNGFDDSSERAQAQAALVPRLREAIRRNNDRCESEESFAGLANVLFWQRQAERIGVATSGNLLARSQILLGLCARPVVEAAELPQELQVGFPHSLNLRFGMLFDGQQDAQGAPFQVKIVADGLDVQNPSGLTNLQGEYTTVVSATREGVVLLTATACFIVPGTITPTDVCVSQKLVSGGQDLTGPWGGTFLVTEQDGTPVNRPIDCGLTLEQNQNAVSGRFSFGCDSDFTLAFAATLSGTELSNVSIDCGAACCFLEGAGTVSGDTITLSMAGPCEGGSIRVTIEAARVEILCP